MQTGEGLGPCDWCKKPIQRESEEAYLDEGDCDYTAHYIPEPCKEWHLHVGCYEDVQQSISDREWPDP